MSEKTQLTRITVPAITDVEYVEGLADAFDKINDNFKKIASLPFLQGVQGDSYQLEEYKIWNDDWTITEDGKVLLESIFGKDVTLKVDGNNTSIVNSFDDIRSNIGEELDGVSPLDFFVTEDKNTIINNTLYFYVIKDDTGNIIEKELGQFYYFVDGRLKSIGNVYNSENAGSLLSVFNDYTGFYQYKNNSYTRLEILPSIYYDQNKNDICWKFNGNETGISAIGIKGADGKDAELLIVRVTTDDENAYTATVDGMLNPIVENFKNEKWIEDPTYFKKGKALICVQNTKNEPQDFVYGQVVSTDNFKSYQAYWEPNYNFSKLIGNNRITNYFYNMGADDTATSPFFLAIPSVYNRGASGTTEDKKKAHVIKGYESETDDTLNVFYSEGAFNENGNQELQATESGVVKSLHVKNYNVSLDNNFSVNGTSVFNDDVQLNGDLNIKGTLDVTNKSTLNSDLEVGGTVLINNGSSSNNKNEGALVVVGGAGIGGKLNIGEDVVIENKLTVKGTAGALDYNDADVTISGGVGISKDVIIGSSGKMKIKNSGVVYKSDNTIETDDAALNVIGDIYSGENIIVSKKSESSYSVLTGANDSNVARGVSGLQTLVEANNEGTIFAGGGTQIQTSTIGQNGLNRTVYNRTSLQSYNTNSSKKYTTQEYHINPCGGPVFVNRYAEHGGTGDILGSSNALVVDGGLYARTKKPTYTTDVGSTNGLGGLSNVLIGHNDPENSDFEDFPKDLDKGGYPLVIKSLQSNGSETNGAMVFGAGDIYALSGNNITGWSASTLHLNYRNGYKGDVQIGKNLNVGDNSVGGNVTIYSSSKSNGKLIVEGTTSSTSKNTGALVVKGGAGIGGSVYIGNDEFVSGKITGRSGLKIENGGEIIGFNNGFPGGIGLIVEGGSGTTVSGNSGGIGLIVRGGTCRTGSTGLGLKVERGGAEIYSGTGSTTDNNILKVNSSNVLIGGTKGELKLAGSNSSLTVNGGFDASYEMGSDLSKITDSNHPDHIYLGAAPDDKSSPINRLLINRHAIQAYTTYGTTTDGDGEEVSIYKSPSASYFRINPCGGGVSIGSSGSTNTNSNLTVHGTIFGSSINISNGGNISSTYGKITIPTSGSRPTIENGLIITDTIGGSHKSTLTVDSNNKLNINNGIVINGGATITGELKLSSCHKYGTYTLGKDGVENVDLEENYVIHSIEAKTTGNGGAKVNIRLPNWSGPTYNGKIICINCYQTTGGDHISWVIQTSGGINLCSRETEECGFILSYNNNFDTYGRGNWIVLCSSQIR